MSKKIIAGGGQLRRNLATLGFWGLGAVSAVFVLSGTFAPENVSAESGSSTLSVTVTPAIAIRLLDSTATTEISELPFNILTTAAGVSTSNNFIVDVATSNDSGYTLYMNSNYKTNEASSSTGSSSAGDAGSNTGSTGSSTESDAEYTTNLTHTDPTVASRNGKIPTSITASSNYWNYSGSWNETVKDLQRNDVVLSGTIDPSLIPAKNNPTTIRSDEAYPVDSSKTNIDINVNVNTAIPAGTYKNRLEFTAIANPNPVTYALNYNTTSGDSGSGPAVQTDIVAASSKTFTIPSTKPTKTGYTFIGWSEDQNTATGSGTGENGLYLPGDTITLIADDAEMAHIQRMDKTLYAFYSINTYKLTVNPNGGTYSGTTSNTTITQNYNTTTTLSTPTNFYTITYNANSQGASYTASPTSASRAFSSWSYSGSGSLSGNTYTFTGDGTVTAQYNTTSAAFTLPAITKTDYTCKWAEGSTSGTQYEGGTSRTITSNKTYYAVCEADVTNSIKIGSYTYTTAVQSTSATQSQAASICSKLTLDGKSWTLPTQAQFNNAISSTANKKLVYDTWGAGSYWSSTRFDTSLYLYLKVTSATSASINAAYSNKLRVVCVQK